MKADSYAGFEAPPVEGLETNADRPEPVFVPHAEIRCHGYAFAGAIAATALLVLWAAAGIETHEASGYRWENEARLMCFAILSGITGGLIHAATSFAAYAGNRQLLKSWLWWFYLRGPIAGLLAVIVYFGIRAEVFGDVYSATNTNLYYIGFLCGLAGMFSKQVTDKLADLIDVLFAPSRSLGRKDRLTDPAAKGSAEGTEPTPEFNEIVQRAQQLLVSLEHLPPTRTDGTATADGLLGPELRAAIDAFLAENSIDGEMRTELLGEENQPDYWTRLVALLEDAADPSSETAPDATDA